MALAHKGLTARKPFRGALPRRKRDRPAPIRGGCRCCSTTTRAVVDSWVIANYLEDAYPEQPSLFGGEGGRAVGRMLNWWGDMTVVGGIFPLIIADIPQNLKPVDAVYFRKSREARFGKPLEEIMASRDKAVEGFRKSLDPLRLTLRTQAYIGGAAANYADYIVFGAFQWARVVSPFKLFDGRRSGLCLARAAVRRVRRHGAQVAKLSRVGPAQPSQPFPVTRSFLITVATILAATPVKSDGFR